MALGVEGIHIDSGVVEEDADEVEGGGVGSGGGEVERGGARGAGARRWAMSRVS